MKGTVNQANWTDYSLLALIPMLLAILALCVVLTWYFILSFPFIAALAVTTLSYKAIRACKPQAVRVRV